MSGYFGKKPGFRVQPLTLSQIWTQLAGDARTISGLWDFSTTPKFSALTSGSIPFIGSGGQVSQSNGNLFFDSTNNRLGVGTTGPNTKIEARDGSNTQICFGTAADCGGLYATPTLTSIAYGFRIVSGAGTARQTAAAQYRLTSTGHEWYFNTGLTIGNTVVSTKLMDLNATGLGVKVTPACAADIGGTIRATSFTSGIASGVGLTLDYGTTANLARALAYDYGGAAYKNLALDAANIYLRPSGSLVLTVDSNAVTAAKPVVFASYTLATLPTASGATRGQVWCSDHTGGARYVYSDGTNWRDVRTGNVAA